MLIEYRGHAIRANALNTEFTAILKGETFTFPDLDQLKKFMDWFLQEELKA